MSFSIRSLSRTFLSVGMGERNKVGACMPHKRLGKKMLPGLRESSAHQSFLPICGRACRGDWMQMCCLVYTLHSRIVRVRADSDHILGQLTLFNSSHGITGWPFCMVTTCHWPCSGSSGRWLTATVSIYCPGRMTEHPKSKSTKGFYTQMCHPI